MDVSNTVSVLTALANAQSPREALHALREAHELLGENLETYLPLLETLAGRAREVHQLRQLAGSDELTGIANRRAFRDALEREVSRHDRHGGAFAVILLDLDGLKAINDEHGHAVGDEAIMTTARAIARCLRGCDLVARLGGDEFAVLLAGADAAGADVVARRLRHAIESSVVAGQELRVSLGVVDASGEPRSADEILAEADTNLYRDKRSRKFDSMNPGLRRTSKRPAARASVVRLRSSESIQPESLRPASIRPDSLRPDSITPAPGVASVRPPAVARVMF